MSYREGESAYDRAHNHLTGRDLRPAGLHGLDTRRVGKQTWHCIGVTTRPYDTCGSGGIARPVNFALTRARVPSTE